MTVIMASGITDRNNLEDHKKRLYDELTQRFGVTHLVNPRRTAYVLATGNRSTAFSSQGVISVPQALVALATLGRERSTGFMVQYFNHLNVLISDGVSRYMSTDSTKTFAQLSRWRRNCAPTTLIGFGKRATLLAVNSLPHGLSLPLVYKPVGGRRGEGVRLLRTSAQVRQAIEQHFSAESDADDSSELEPIMLQALIDRSFEYRVVLYDGQCLGVVRKNRRPGGFEEEIRWGGGIFLETRHPEAPTRYVLEKCGFLEGLVGVDVMKSRSGEWFIIEENRSPGAWDEFQRITGCDIAVAIASAIFQKF